MNRDRAPAASPVRRSQLAQRAIDAIFRPRSVAVVGASRRPQSIGHEILHNLITCGFEGPVYPVNAKARSVHSIRAYPDLASIPGPVDLAVIVVPRDEVEGVVEQCGRHGVSGLVVITAGFAETGEGGARLERRLAARIARHGMRMIGPNCMGVINTEPAVRLNATFAATPPSRGNVGFLSQSGALGEAILADAAESGLGVAMFASMGNKTDVSSNDLLEYWERNDEVQAILMYLESLGNPRHFAKIARRVSRTKAIITVKAGRTAAGARAASSHTGSIVGLDFAVDSLLEQCGVLRVSTMEEMFVQAVTLANQPIPRGDRVAIVTNAGGPGILCTDACVAGGLVMAELKPSTRERLARHVPREASLANPVDMIASADAARYRAVLEIVRADPGVDAVIAIFVSPIMIDAYEVARAIADAADGEKPVLSVFMGRRRSAEGVDELRRRRVPVYRFPEEAASALAAACRYRKLRDAPSGRSRRFRVDRASAARAIQRARAAGRLALDPAEASQLLGAYGLPAAEHRVARTPAEAIAAAQELGYPVVLKLASSAILHKTDVGGVRVDLRHADEVGRAYREMVQALSSKPRDLRVLVQPMVSGGREVILGMSRDPQFGPVMLFGLGGIFVETMRDVSVRLHPVTDLDAAAMVDGIRGRALLTGVRGERPAALDFAKECLLRLSQLVGDFEPEISEIDLNPLILTPDRATSFVVDARVLLAPVDGARRRAKPREDGAGSRRAR